MSDFGDEVFIRTLKIPPDRRTYQDLNIIFAFLRTLEALSWLREPALYDLSRLVRYEIHSANDILYCRGELALCWYILLSGSVFIDGSMFLPRSSFGKRAQGGSRRPNECLILEPSEMIAIDYPDVQLMHPGQRPVMNHCSMDKMHLGNLDHREMAPIMGSGNLPLSHANSQHSSTDIHFHPSHSHHQHQLPHSHIPGVHSDLPDLLRGGRSRGSVGSSVRDGSDTSSAYSGSDTMCRSVHSLDQEDVDLSGLMETAVDSDEEDLVENVESLSVQDAVRDCLEKDPSDRTEADVKILLEFTERLSAFSNLTLGIRKAMCRAMVFAVVEKADTILMNDGEELDSWSVIINGHVEVIHPDGSVHKLFLGDSFGITPTTEKLYHRGVMRSKVDDCQFVCIKQSDYYEILRQSEENTLRHEEDGVLVLVTEKSHIDACHREANIVIKGTSERLMQHLVEVENILDPTYVEDFLLMHRKFIPNSVVVARKLLYWFDDPKYQDIVIRVFLRWVQSYFTDFEMDPEMMECLEAFEEGLQRKGMSGQLFFLSMVCMTNARARTVTLMRPSRDEPLQFTVVGRKNFGVFVASVEKGSKAEEVGLKRADQLLEVNGQSLKNASRTDALELLVSTCHLEMTVKSNLHTYNDMLQTPENAHKSRHRKTSDFMSSNGACPGHLDFVSTLNLNVALSSQGVPGKKQTKGPAKALKLRDFLSNFMMAKSNNVEPPPAIGFSDESVSSHSSTTGGGGPLYRSRSNPDLSTTDSNPEGGKPEFPDHVLKVYRATDQSTRFLPVHKETTAREVVMLALSLFNISEPSQNYALYEVSVTEGPSNQQNNVVKQKRLPDSLQNLAERIGLSSRYYLRSVTSSQNLCPEDVVNDLVRESQLSLLQLNSVVELAIQITLEDFAVFRQIEPTEYVDNLFKIKSKYGTPALSKFEEISNRELFWVCTEVCQEHNVQKRAKIIKQFIKIAKYCKDLNNFNSMFAILSGLGSSSVSRLRQSWSRVPSRYRKIFSDLETVMDPSQNMKNYRKLANSSFSQSPLIPFYPIVKKDLLFLHEGNDDKVDGLINFEKLRTIAKSIRKLGEMCSGKYCPSAMLEKLGHPQSTAMLAMNQAITGGGAQQSSTVKRRKKSTALPDKKKMFEEAQMVRRVKCYLKQLRVIRDEEVLIKLSHECEPPATPHTTIQSPVRHPSVNIPQPPAPPSTSGLSLPQPTPGGGSNSAPPSNSQVRRRHHSPTPSTASSNSSEGKKIHARFGAASPTSERKILSLAEVTKKPHHGRRPPAPSPSPGAPRRSTNDPAEYLSESSSQIALSPVHLNAESSSVTSFGSYAVGAHHRKGPSVSTTSVGPSGSSSSECSIGGPIPPPSASLKSDSGVYGGSSCSSSVDSSSFECRYPPPSSPPPSPSHQRRFSHQAGVCGVKANRRTGLISGGAIPPDYTPSHGGRILPMGRTGSHDGLLFYRHSRHEEEDDAQVSAV